MSIFELSFLTVVTDPRVRVCLFAFFVIENIFTFIIK